MAMPPKKRAPRWRGERKIGFSAVLGIWSRSVAVCECSFRRSWEPIEDDCGWSAAKKCFRTVQPGSRSQPKWKVCWGNMCRLGWLCKPNQTAAWSSLWSILRATHNPRKRDLARWDDSLLCSLYPAFQLCAASNIYQRKFPLQLASNINQANSSPSWILFEIWNSNVLIL